MTKTKLTTSILGGIFALSAIAIPNINATGVFAEGAEDSANATPTVKVGVDQEDIYVSSGCKTNTASTAKYCASGNKLTFTNYNDGIIKITDLSKINIDFSGTNKFKPEMTTSSGTTYHGTIFSFSSATSSNAEVTISGEEDSKVILAEPTVTVGTNKSLDIFANYKTLTYEDITLEADVSFLSENDRGNTRIFIPGNTSNTTIESGTITAKNFYSLIMNANSSSNFTVNDGEINTDGGISMSGSVTINGGTLTTNQVSGHYGGFTINNGSLTINSTRASAGGALMSYEFVRFLGGTTKITAPAGGDLVYTSNSELTFGEGMCASGNVTIEGANIYPNDTSVPGEVTITKGNCPVTPAGDDTGDIKTPNTGFEKSGAILATVIAIPSIIAAAIAGRALYRRFGHQISFKK